MDVNAFIAERRPAWEHLEALLRRVDSQGLKKLELPEVRLLGHLYREASADLLRARSHSASAELVDYLNDLVARAHGRIHPARRPRWRDLRDFYARDFPRLVRREWRAIALSTAFFVAGSSFGGVAMALDPGAWAYLMPEQHKSLDPDERVARDSEGETMSADDQAMFSAFLFTHNIQVTILAFAVGIFAGLLTAVVLFMNGVLLGALAWAYHSRGHGVFFWQWILPHGALELSAIFIAGGAGFVLGRAILAPGRHRRGDAVRVAGRTAVRLVLGLAPILVVAGIIEGTLAQWHPPLVQAELKLAFAALAFALLWLYLLRAGRAPP